MSNEIERKFYVKELPDLASIQPVKYERYFLDHQGPSEMRISKVDDRYIYEEKTRLSAWERERTSKQITEDEFNELTSKATGVIIREKYDISQNPKISLQIYHGNYEGLIRAEVEFESIEEAKAFTALPWMGNEMTQLPIANDATLIELSVEEFKKYL